jgi:ABC-type dipeptide/oligopeptide/nickel transport system permease component/CubicO group peptidase (beta-lactamase class C family)
MVPAWFARRLATALIAYVGITFLLFELVRNLVGPAVLGQQWLGQGGAFLNPVQQYFAWLVDLFTNTGYSRSFSSGESSEAVVLAHLGPTLLLFGSALVVQAIVGVLLGVASAIGWPGWPDRAIGLLAVLTMAAPPFLTALLAVYVFAALLHWLPASGMFTPSISGIDIVDRLAHLVLPTVVLASLNLGRIVRYVRVGLLDAMGTDYAMLARAKGADRWRIVRDHALPNALAPAITAIGLQLSVLLGGSFLVEIVFSWPGMGTVAFQALLTKPVDAPILLDYAAIAAIAVLLGSLFADVALLAGDPRLRAATAPVSRLGDVTVPLWAPRAALLIATAVWVVGAVAPDPLHLAVIRQSYAPPPTTAPVRPPLATSSPRPSVGPRPTPFLADRSARVARVMAGLPFGSRPRQPGCSVAIADQGTVDLARGFGSADLATEAPLTPATLFDVEAVSAQLTDADVPLLAQDGRLRLTDDVRTYVPELPDFGTPISITDLITAQSGLPDLSNLVSEIGFDSPALRASMSDADILAALRAIPGLVSTPGTTYADVGTNAVVLRFVVERISGRTLADFTRQRIFGPLGMTASSFVRQPQLPRARLATPYSRLLDGGWTVTNDGSDLWAYGAAHLETNVLDLLKWERNFATGTVGGPAFLAAQVRTTAPANQPVPDRASAAGFLVQTVAGRHLLTQAGLGDSGYAADVTIDPAQGVTIAIACNTNNYFGEPLGLTILDAWLGTPTTVVPGDITR